jgi:hypothetical protein
VDFQTYCLLLLGCQGDLFTRAKRISARSIAANVLIKSRPLCTYRPTMGLSPTGKAPPFHGAHPNRSFSRYDLKVCDGCNGDLVEPVVTGTSSGPISIFAEHGPEMGSSFGDVPLLNHFKAELEVAPHSILWPSQDRPADPPTARESGLRGWQQCRTGVTRSLW